MRGVYAGGAGGARVCQATCAAGRCRPPTCRCRRRRGSSTRLAPANPVMARRRSGDGDGEVDRTGPVGGSCRGVGAGRCDDGDVRTRTLPATSCDAVTPVAPELTQAVCVGGVVTAPTLTLADTDVITYTAAPPDSWVSGGGATITATLNDTASDGPTRCPTAGPKTSSTTATYEVTFADVVCIPVTPVAPMVTQATCVNGVVTAPTIELATTPGLVYVADPAGPYDPTVDTDVVVTATVLDGFGWEDAGASGFARQSVAPSQVELPDGWTWVTPTEATFAVALAAIPPCPEIVAPTSSAAAELVESTTTTSPPSTTSPPAAPPTVAEGQTIPAGTEAASEVAAAAPPTTIAPTTIAPTTIAPTTIAPTTIAPTTDRADDDRARRRSRRRRSRRRRRRPQRRPRRRWPNRSRGRERAGSRSSSFWACSPSPAA